MISRMWFVLVVCAVVASVSSADLMSSSAHVRGDVTHNITHEEAEDAYYDETGTPTVFGQALLQGAEDSYYAESWAFVESPSASEFRLDVGLVLDPRDSGDSFEGHTFAQAEFGLTMDSPWQLNLTRSVVADVGGPFTTFALVEQGDDTIYSFGDTSDFDTEYFSAGDYMLVLHGVGFTNYVGPSDNYDREEWLEALITPVPVPGAFLLASLGTGWAGYLLRRRTRR